MLTILVQFITVFLNGITEADLEVLRAANRESMCRRVVLYKSTEYFLLVFCPTDCMES
jgi:hypothetical protein